MDTDTVIEVEGLSKKFCRSVKRSMFYGALDIGRSMVGIPYSREKLRPGEFWALDNVSFSLKRGETLGLIGANGSGKSTLLRLLTGIFPPDKGRISIRGRIGALIAVGAGFHPHMTGRENIYLNGTILGMTRQEVNAQFDNIVSFADIGEFIDAPVSTYSSGMTVRLGFSIAIHSHPSILLADEVLAVGDLEFALRCFRKIAEFQKNGGTIILVSHSMQLVKNSCQRALWVQHGAVALDGTAVDVCGRYETKVFTNQGSREAVGTRVNNDPMARIVSVDIVGSDGVHRSTTVHGEPFRCRIRYACTRIVRDPVVTMSITTENGAMLISNYTNFDGSKRRSIDGEGYIDFIIERLPLAPGKYSVTITFTENGQISDVLDWLENCFTFSVSPAGSTSYGLINPFPRWEWSPALSIAERVR
ncbi:MAG: ABC transporter ATP-binding protein [Spirochaetota bacterium]